MVIISEENCTNKMCDLTNPNNLLQKIIAYIIICVLTNTFLMHTIFEGNNAN